MELDTIKKFISIIQNYPEIYAVGQRHYKNIYKKETAWRKIKEKLGIDVKKLKIKWRNLRDTYKKHKHCRQIGLKGPNSLYNWVWAEQMAFVEPYINLKQTDSSNSTDSELKDNIDEEDAPNETQKDQSPEPETETEKNKRRPEPEPETETEINNRRPEKRRREDSDVAPPLNIMTNINTEIYTEKKPPEPVVEVPCDRTDMEFLGYSNTVKRLSLRSQALVKLQITKIVTQFQLQELTNSNNTTLGHTIFNDDGTYTTTVQLTDLGPYLIDVEQKHSPDVETSTTS